MILGDTTLHQPSPDRAVNHNSGCIHLLDSPPFKSISLWFGDKDVVWDCAEGLGEVQVEYISRSSLADYCSHSLIKRPPDWPGMICSWCLVCALAFLPWGSAAFSHAEMKKMLKESHCLRPAHCRVCMLGSTATCLCKKINLTGIIRRKRGFSYFFMRLLHLWQYLQMNYFQSSCSKDFNIPCSTKWRFTCLN